ncbi:MAG TPA: crotonase/enoyl-CoA hydratase family protein [Solirubrobacteraceae bacterium]|jgi:enoyl-CoA hydratase/carnithine racemase|nr:crotonase/enoyl-CoA hydratase family protein [Solirubrobacteraceae bacterium]
MSVTVERVSIEMQGGVAVVTMRRPDKHNALDQAMFTALREAAAEVSRRPAVRAVVLCGEGPSFCSGIDLLSLAAEGGLDQDVIFGKQPGHPGNNAQRIATDWQLVPVPVIAAIQGTCFGGGMQLALGPDMRICAPDARLSILEIKWGLIPDVGLTRTLPPLVGLDVAKELTFTGRIVSGHEAKELGLVTRVADDPLAAALELAQEIAARSPDAIRAGKRIFQQIWPQAPIESLQLEEDVQKTLIGSPNQLEAVRAGMAREPARFVDP